MTEFRTFCKESPRLNCPECGRAIIAGSMFACWCGREPNSQDTPAPSPEQIQEAMRLLRRVKLKREDDSFEKQAKGRRVSPQPRLPRHFVSGSDLRDLSLDLDTTTL